MACFSVVCSLNADNLFAPAHAICMIEIFMKYAEHMLKLQICDYQAQTSSQKCFDAPLMLRYIIYPCTPSLLSEFDDPYMKKR
jgi:hypothetical protein